MRLAGSVTLRPVRIGFLLPPDDLSALRRVIRLCCCLWGGRYNPIIPFFENPSARWIAPYQHAQGLDVARGYVDFFEPDVLVEAFEGMAAKIGWTDGKYRFQLPRVIPLDKFYEVDHRGDVDFAAGVDIVNVMHHLYDQEYKYQRRHKRPFSLVATIADDDAFFDVVLGAYPETEELKYVMQTYHDVFEPEALPSSVSTSLKILNEGHAGPLWISRHGLEESLGRRGISGRTIFIFDPTNSADVIEYWNYRLFHRGIVPISLKWIAEHTALLRDLIVKTHRPIPGNPFGTMFDTHVCFARSIADEVAGHLVREHLLNLPDRSFFSGRSPMIWRETKNGNRRDATKIVVSAKSEPFDEEVTAEGSVKIPAPAPGFEKAAHLYTRTSWINVISPSSSSYRGEEPAVVYPSNLWSPEYPSLAFGDEFTVTREGWVTPQRYSTGFTLVRPMSGRDALVGWFKANGVEAHPSEAGQIAAQIISVAGGLLACGMFADFETLSLLNGMAESHAEQNRQGKLVKTTNPDRAKPVDFIRQHFDTREKRSFGYWNTLNYFLERSVFRAGLRVQCPTCAHYNWFDLDTISYAPTCNRCLRPFKFAQGPADLKQIRWFYRVIGPFAAPDYARGSYAVALTIRCMAEGHQTELSWCTGLDLRNLNCEIDFAAWYRRSSMFREVDEPVFVVGEAKSFGRGAIDDGAISNLRRVAERFPGTILVVSSLRPISAYSPDEIQRLAELARWGRRSRTIDGRPSNAVIILTATELLAQGPIAGEWKKVGGCAAELVKYPSVDLTDLHELAEATQRLYLNLPPFYLDYRDRLQSQRERLLNLIKQRAK
jgi:hypothetical protein